MQKLFKVTLKVTKKCNLETLVKYVTKHDSLHLENMSRVLPKKIILLGVSEEELDVLRADSKKIGFGIKSKEYTYNKKKRENSSYGHFGKGIDNDLTDDSYTFSLYPTSDSINDMIVAISDQLVWKDAKDSFINLINETLSTFKQFFTTMDEIRAGELFIYNNEWGSKSDIEQGNMNQMPGNTTITNPYLYNKSTYVCIRGTNKDGSPASSYYSIMGGERGTIDENKIVYPINKFSNGEILKFIILDFVTHKDKKIEK